MVKNTRARWRWLALLSVIAMFVAACGSSTSDTTAASGGTTATTAGSSPTETTAPAPSTEAFTYKVGIFQDTTTDNFWAYYDPESSVWNAYLLGATKPALYTYDYPGITFDNDVAADPEAPEPVQEGDVWTVTVPMRTDATWSDGSPITADDIVFTYETVRDLALGGDWLSAYPVAPDDNSTLGLTNVEAVDANTVKFSFNQRPGLAVWPNNVGLGPIMDKAFWADKVDAAKGSDDPAAALYAESGAGDLSGGPTTFDSRTAGAGAHNVANTGYYDIGRTITSGDATYNLGPFFSDMQYTLYGDQNAAVLALKAGEVDYLFNPLGLQRGLSDQITSDENLTPVVNPTNGFRYLAFNLRREPMSNQSFRDALALMIDKEFMATSVLQGVAFPLYATVPEGNGLWYNKEKADGYAAEYAGKSTEDRLNEAVATLKAGGFTWDVEPTYANGAVVNGSGVKLNGKAVPHLEILAPGPGYDPLRATYSIWIATWLKQLGFDADANPTDFNTIVDKVFVPADGTLNYDMFILGWSLGNPAFPSYHESFWAGKNDTLVNDGNNNTGFNDPAFNDLADQYNAATSESDAYDIMWQMEDILFEKKPYILLFDTGIFEAYRSTSIDYPFTDSLSGIQFLNGMQGLVTAAK